MTLTFRAGQQSRPGEPPVGIDAPRDRAADDQGRFAFRNLGAGSYRITAQRQGSVSRPGERIVPSTPLVLGVGRQLTGFVLRLAPRAVITGETRRQRARNTPASYWLAARFNQAGPGNSAAADKVPLC